MSPICSRAAFRVLTTVLVASSIANAVALPHQVLDPRTPLAQDDASSDAPVEASATPGVDDGDNPDNVFEDFGEILRDHSGYDFLRDLIERLFGLRSEEDDGDDGETATTTVYVTPTPMEVSSSETVVTPAGPPVSTATDGGSETTPSPSPTDIMSILPVGPMTTAINITIPDSFFSTELLPESSSSVSEVVPPFSVNSTSAGPFPTAVSITGEFNATILPGTGFPSASVNISTTKVQVTSVLLVTATVVPSPVSVGTGLAPISETATPLWSNSTLATPTPVSGTGAVSAATGISNATATETPTYPNTTLVIPIVINVTGIPATVLNVSLPVTIAPYANATTVLPTPYSGTGTAADASATFSDIPLYPNATTYTGLLGTGTSAPSAGYGAPPAGTISGAPAVDTAAPIYPNVTTLTSTTTTTIGAASVSILPSLLPGLNETSSNDTASEFPGLLTLRRLCQDPQIRVITLPLLNRFYGPNAYPSLTTFPGCVAPNARQAIQAPGLLNCSALGTEVQRCQASGRKVLLSVKADGLDAVGGNADFGDPAGAPQPFGPYFAGDDDNDDDNEFGEEKKKRQVELNITLAIPHHLPHHSTPLNLAAPPPVVGTVSPLAAPSSTAIYVPESEPIYEAPFPLANSSAPAVASFSASAVPAPAPSSTAVSEPQNETTVEPVPTNNEPTTVSPFPNLFDENHPPSAFALTLFSLFGEGHTERADLRPLGPDVGSPSSPSFFNGTSWITPPTSIVPSLDRPLGEEVVVDGFDVQVPVQWKGSYQDQSFKDLVARLRELNKDAWRESGGVEGGPGDLGADGRSVVYFGWIGQLRKAREAKMMRQGWVEWDGQTWG